MKNYLGRKVRMKSNELHFEFPYFYPTEEVIGEVIGQKAKNLNFMILVQWPEGSTSDSDKWFVSLDDNDILVEWERGTVTKSDWVEERGKYSW